MGRNLAQLFTSLANMSDDVIAAVHPEHNQVCGPRPVLDSQELKATNRLPHLMIIKACMAGQGLCFQLLLLCRLSGFAI